MSRHRHLLAWQRSHALVLAVYRCSASWPSNERFGLVAQARRAAVSVAANIAEGAARDGPREFHRFLQVSLGSLAELEYQLQLAGELGYIGAPELEELSRLQAEAARLLILLTRSMKKASRSTS